MLDALFLTSMAPFTERFNFEYEHRTNATAIWINLTRPHEPEHPAQPENEQDDDDDDNDDDQKVAVSRT